MYRTAFCAFYRLACLGLLFAALPTPLAHASIVKVAVHTTYVDGSFEFDTSSLDLSGNPFNFDFQNVDLTMTTFLGTRHFDYGTYNGGRFISDMGFWDSPCLSLSQGCSASHWIFYISLESYGNPLRPHVPAFHVGQLMHFYDETYWYDPSGVPLGRTIGGDVLTITEVPEPSSLLMLGFGLAGLIAVKKKTRR
jgi:hypothetical protein